MDLGLSDRVFVVTGGSRGLGRATAEVLVGEGAKVVLAARDPNQLNATVASLGPDRAFGRRQDSRRTNSIESSLILLSHKNPRGIKTC